SCHNRTANFRQIFLVGVDNQLTVVFVCVFCTGIQDRQQHLLTSCCHTNYTFAIKLKHHTTSIGHATTVFGQCITNFWKGTVFVVSCGLDNNPHASRAHTFV